MRHAVQRSVQAPHVPHPLNGHSIENENVNIAVFTHQRFKTYNI